jgi:hypothetical protein
MYILLVGLFNENANNRNISGLKKIILLIWEKDKTEKGVQISIKKTLFWMQKVNFCWLVFYNKRKT